MGKVGRGSDVVGSTRRGSQGFGAATSRSGQGGVCGSLFLLHRVSLCAGGLVCGVSY